MDKSKYIQMNKMQMLFSFIGAAIFYFTAVIAFANFDFNASPGEVRHFELHEKLLIYSMIAAYIVIIVMEFRFFTKLNQSLRLYDSVFLISYIYIVCNCPVNLLRAVILCLGLVGKCIWRIKNADRILKTAPVKHKKVKKK